MRSYKRAPWNVVFIRVVAWLILGIFSALALIGGTVWLKDLLSSLLNKAFR